MKTSRRAGFAIGAVILMVVGLYYLSYGAVYRGTYFLQEGIGGCGIGCTSSGYSSAEVTFLAYPLWSPPTWNHVNYSAPLCNPTPNATFTPQNPPPSCLYPPADFSADYSHNVGGASLIALGAIAAIVIMNRREAPSETASTAP